MRARAFLWLLAGSMIIGLGFAAVLGPSLYALYYRPMVAIDNEPVRFCIDKSSSASTVVHTLQNQHFIQSPRVLLRLLRLQGLSSRLKAGIYQIKPGESAMHFLSRVAKGDVLTQTFRIVDGTTMAQIAVSLKSASELHYRAKDWLALKGAYPNAEGLLLADTYRYDAGSTSFDVLNHAHKNLLQALSLNWQQRTPGLPYKTAYELLIAASIIEKEAAIAEEKRLISGVIVNRLRNNMPLQMDPTVIYALGARYQGKLSHADLQVDSPYNTYKYRGLPPTPIAMVGKDALDAAAHPTLSNYLYFVATGDGRHYFSVNYEEQKQAVARFRGKK